MTLGLVYATIGALNIWMSFVGPIVWARPINACLGVGCIAVAIYEIIWRPWR